MKEKLTKIIKLINDNYTIFRFGAAGIMYVVCIIFIANISKMLIEYPILIAYKYNIEISGAEYIELYNNYKVIFLGTLITSVCAIPVARLVNRLRRASKDGAEFYAIDEKQNSINISSLGQREVSQEAVIELINSDDSSSYDEKGEEYMYEALLTDQDNQLNLLKCQNIKINMKKLTLLVTRELFYNHKNNITLDITAEYVKQYSKRRLRRTEQENLETAKNIITFLKNSDIIESDDIEDGTYYFTSFGESYMNSFLCGII